FPERAPAGRRREAHSHPADHHRAQKPNRSQGSDGGRCTRQMWPEGDGPRHFRNFTKFISGTLVITVYKWSETALLSVVITSTTETSSKIASSTVSMLLPSIGHIEDSEAGGRRLGDRRPRSTA